MAATAPINTPERPNLSIAYPLAAATKVFAGTLAALDANGRMVPAADTAGLRVVGRAEDTFDNSAGAAAAISGVAKRSTFKFANSGTQPLLAADIGKECFVEDDQTVAKTSTNKVKAGRFVALDADGGVWVDTTQASRVPSADTITGAADLTALKTALLALLQGQGLVK